ncbi:MAG: Na+/H+ antiporter NhaC [Algoriphagus sp.]|jgi:NhaC family Na+:H+ antiporter|uniref:Na+/H+ antiporter NhaC n=3 Tax=Algoriphagus TaxID=246875 RepID=UPI000C508651|nr:MULTISPECIES: Na+/H+ antiporter NhaC [unclassified Algoriphagus]MAL13027.1 Na+/H+ antiporter NhaC [Algoriphagus sp.]MAN85796.1 Na+/H+ antiporter NhaC [Algoriphagus sp.]HCB46905.1 Na+/H+ antiporter NhaC [Algoriphagus sp.]|tara:strand:+ start:6202 stop:7653 length:1452 start_codon:yes stop_codon:yes gene_type:complete
MQENIRAPKVLDALIPLIFLIVLLVLNIRVFGTDGLSGSNQIVLILSAGVAALVAIYRLGFHWETLQDGMVKSISSAMSSILILFLIGALAGTWLISGIVPAMIYYGLQVLSPTIFLFAACIVSAVVSVSTGSSWTTVATVGVALLGIGKALGFEEGIIAGAIISGAYFGDKMSPLSDTTNLAPAMAGTDLFTHIKHMAKTTVPSIIITFIIFIIIGFNYETNGSVDDVKAISQVIQENFNINGWLFIVPLVVLVLIVKKVPAIPALLVGALLGGVFAIIFQPEIIALIADEGGSYAYLSFKAVMMSLYGEISVVTSNDVVNELLVTRGMGGMLNTIWLIICAMIFGGIMEVSGMLRVLAEAVIQKVHRVGSLIASTAATCVFFNITTSDQYLAILVPGRMYADVYKKRKLKPENLSRTLEDSATVTSVLVPWNTCGATQASVLGVATLVYAPYCFFNIISPFMTILYGYLNIGINYYEEEEV